MAFQDKKFLDAEGITHLVRLLDEYPNNQVLGSVIDAIEGELEQKAEKSEIPNVPVQDVQINGSSIINNGVANLSVKSSAVKDSTDLVTSGGMYKSMMYLVGTDSYDIQHKLGTKAVTPALQHEAAFFGLSKAAGADLANEESITVGTYPASAKTAIQTMLDVPAKTDIPEVPVQDVQVNGVSVLNDGVANIPYAELPSGFSAGNFGVISLKAGRGIAQNVNDHSLYLAYPSENQLKKGNETFIPVTTGFQHASAFYGLAKAAGADMKDIANTTVGTYPDAQKEAIQSMLGITQMLAPTNPNLVASQAYSIGDVFTANGKLYKATAAIAADGAIITDGANANCEETNVGEGFVKFTDAATSTTPGVVRINGYGLSIGTTGNIKDMLYISYASTSAAKLGISYYNPIVPHFQEHSVFYGLSKAAGVDLANEEVTLGTYPETSKTAIRSLIGAAAASDITVSDVQVNGTSIISNGIANIPIADRTVLGAIKIASVYGIQRGTGGLSDYAVISFAGSSIIKTAGTSSQATYQPIVPRYQHESVFYGLAKAAGDTTQSASSNAVGVYTDNAKASIKAMLGIQDGSTGTVDVSGTDPVITAVENTRYVCGEVTSLSFTPPASGISIVRFTSGSSVTVLTIPSTVKFPEWFDSTSLETNTIYELCVTDGEFGAVMSWAL